ncbi:MAG: hypothetical protein KDB00_13805 [Planctomycetales bacterium]|nr:hypothetical protein [Planctomycetales bacterium]
MNQPETPPNTDPPIQPRTKGEESALGAEKTAANGENASGESVDAAQAAAMLGELKREMNRLQREIRLAIQAQLGQMSGRSLGSIDANRELAQSIQEMLDAHGLRVRCNQCGHPAILRVSPRNGASAGVFVFDHTVDGRRTFHGGRISMPEIRLVAKPARKPRGQQKAG